MKRQPLKYRLNVIGAAVIIFLLIRTYLPSAASRLIGENYKLLIPVYAVILILSCLLPVIFIENLCGFHPDIFRKDARKLNIYEDGALIAFCMMIFLALNVVNSLLVLWLEKFGIVFRPDTLPEISGALEYIMYFIYIALVPAVVEELFLRLMVLNVLKPYGRKFAIIASAIIFTMMHTGIKGYIVIFGCALTLACIYEYTGDIRMSMLLHFANNTYSFIQLMLANAENGQSGTTVSFLVIVFIICAGIISAFHIVKQRINIYSVLKKEGRNAKITTLFSSPVLILSAIGCLIAAVSRTYASLVR